MTDIEIVSLPLFTNTTLTDEGKIKTYKILSLVNGYTLSEIESTFNSILKIVKDKPFELPTSLVNK